MNKAAQALGRRAKGVPKKISAEERAARRQRMAAARAKRWEAPPTPQKLSGIPASCRNDADPNRKPKKQKEKHTMKNTTDTTITAEFIESLFEDARRFSASMSHGGAVFMAVNQAIDFGFMSNDDKYTACDLVAARLRNWEINGK